MKKSIILSVLLLCGLSISSCIQEVLPESLKVSGMWAKVNEQSQASLFVKFEDGKYQKYSFEEDLKTVINDAVWDCSEAMFQGKRIENARYSIQGEDLIVRGAPVGPIKVDGKQMTIGKDEYVCFESFKSENYSVLEVTETSIVDSYGGGTHSIPFKVVNPLPNASVNASSRASFIKNCKVEGTSLCFDVVAGKEDVSGTIALSYPGAKEVVISVKREQKTFIQTSWLTQTYDYTAQAGTLPYSVSGALEGETLNATSSANWLKDVVVGSTKIDFNIEENNSGTPRTATLTLDYKDAKSVSITITQKYSASVISITPSSQSTDYTAKSLSFTYTVSNPRAGVTLSASSQNDWITNVSVSGNTVSYNVGENNTGSSRSGNIKLTYGTVTKTFSVSQSSSATSITVTPASASTDYTSKSLSFTFSVTDPREGISMQVSTVDTWISSITVSGNTVSYDVAENNTGSSRSGSIKLTYGTVTKSFSVTQTYPTLSLSPSSQNTDYLSKSLSFDVTVTNPASGVTLSASSQDDWITNVSVSGNTVSYKVAENNTGSSRSGSIKLTYGTVTKTFSVSQSSSATSITVTPASASTDYTSKGLSFTFSVTDPREGISMQVSTIDTWICNITVSGNTVSYDVAENNTGSSRSGNIKLTYGTVTKIFSVTQTYPTLSLSPSSQSTDYLSKSLSFDVTVTNPASGVTLSASSQDDWITNVSVSGNTVSYKVAENNTGSSRSGSIKLIYGTATKTFNVLQGIASGAIDLGLSVKWRGCNLGASKPEEYGLYYQWGDTQGYGSDTSDGKYFGWKDESGNVTYKWCKGSKTTLTKYNTKSDYGTVDNKTVLEMADDAARAALGGNWRMPTDAEWAELRNTSNCSWTWTTINGVNGYKVQSKKSGYTAHWIFLPAAGFRTKGILYNVGSYGYYWSSSLDTGYPGYALEAGFGSSSISTYDNDRYYGQSVRPVSE